MTVSIISSGAGSVAVSARPAFANTCATSGTERIRRSVCCSSSPILLTEMSGKADGMYKRSPSLSAGMNSPPMRLAGQSAEAAIPSASATVTIGTRSPALSAPIPSDEHAIDRILEFARDAPADKVAHEDRDQRHRKRGGDSHGARLRVGEWREKASLLRFECENRNERKRDDEEREEEGGADFYRRLRDQLPSRPRVWD